MEDVPANRFPTVRFLITDNKPPIRLLRYDPRIRNGPVYYDKKRSQWFWNGVTHFMFDTALPLSECATVTFVDHREDSCNKPSCEEKGLQAKEGGARLLAMLIGQNLIQAKDKTILSLFLNSEQKEKRLHDHAALAWDCILQSLSKAEGGTITSAHPAASALAKAILDRFGSGRRTTDLANLFRNRKELKSSLTARGMKAFGVRSASALSYLEDEED